MLAATLGPGRAFGQADEVEKPAERPDLDKATQSFIEGRYDECIHTARAGLEDSRYNVEWHLLLIDALMVTGQYSNALAVADHAVDQFRTSIRARYTARPVYFYNGQPERADEMLGEINYLAKNRMWAYTDPVNLISLGRAALEMQADPRRVLEQFYDRAKLGSPNRRDVYLAPGDLALGKGDFQLASRIFAEGLRKLPDDPDLLCGQARAFASSDRRRMLDSLDQALTINSNHIPSHLLLVDHLVDAEDYESADTALEDVLRINPSQPEAWAFRAVMAHLDARFDEEVELRKKALAHWKRNPAVDHLIGRKLSQKYRFKEGADYQRQALAYDSSYLPARIQLAQDLLRLGEEEEGWALAKAVHEADGYDATVFNLVNLKEVIDRFTTLTNEHFFLRMSAEEAAIYGQRALALLEQARETLCERYQVELDRPTIVEIFPEQKDFGVRTFGMPDNPGFLGVCFGPVITANSPASRGLSPNNWEAVLWHEFCHVITLQMTRNKMPRWLSEGISVYEERQANPTWGQIMNPEYRAFVLEGDLTPVGELSGAFLAPRSELHLQFAYYQSYLVVDFIVQNYGLDKLRLILHELGEGADINDAIARHTAPLDEIEAAFEEFATQRAEALGPELKWDRPEPEELAEADPDWTELKRDNYYVLMHQAQQFLRAEQWEAAKAPLQHVIEKYPDQRGGDSAYLMLALAHRKLGETELERDALTRFSLLDGDGVDAYLRLMELDHEREDWRGVIRNAERYLAVNPLLPQPYRLLARAATEAGEKPMAINAYQNLLRLHPPDPVSAHFELAKLLHETGDPGARRHVLEALEDAPRFRDAHRLLLKIRGEAPADESPSPSTPAGSPPTAIEPKDATAPPATTSPGTPAPPAAPSEAEPKSP